MSLFVPPVTDPAYRSFAEISLTRIQENYRAVLGTVKPGTQVMPVVKANAYGHGSGRVSNALIAAGARWLAVSSVAEGVALREADVPADVQVVVMAGVLPFEWQQVAEYHLTPVIHDLRDLEALESLAIHAGRQIPFHLKLDTGLSRLGVQESAAAVLTELRNKTHIRLAGVMTHLASSANLRSSQTEEQVARFHEMTAGFREAGYSNLLYHLDATNSIHFERHDTAVQLVRPGLAIYGYVTQPPAPSPYGRLLVRPALTWKARIVLVKDIPAGENVGYGATFRTERPTKVAIVGVGYADGYPHALSNNGAVLVNGRLAPILGAVSMDVTTVDISGIPDVSVGQTVTLLGEEEQHVIDAVHLARRAGTIAYALLCNIQPRVARVYQP